MNANIAVNLAPGSDFFIPDEWTQIEIALTWIIEFSWGSKTRLLKMVDLLNWFSSSVVTSLNHVRGP
jgi:hypothetical protein